MVILIKSLYDASLASLGYSSWPTKKGKIAELLKKNSVKDDQIYVKKARQLKLTSKFGTDCVQGLADLINFGLNSVYI